MKTIALPAAALLLLGSCSTTMYMPNTVNAPLLKEKGEVKINVDQSDIQTAVAVSDHIGVMANGFFEDYKGNNGYEHKGGLGEAGIGYYKLMDEDPVILEIFAGGGLGSISKTEVFTNGAESRTASFDAKAVKFFFQPEIGYAGQVFDIALTSRFSFVKYNHFGSSNYTETELAADYLENGYITSHLFAFAEPALTARLGWKWVKLQAQYGLTINIGGGKIRYPVNFSSMALVIDIAKWYNL